MPEYHGQFYQDPTLGPTKSDVWSTGKPKSSGAIDPRGIAVPVMSELWPGMDSSQFESNPGYLNAPTQGAFGAYNWLSQTAPTPAELASYKALSQVNPNAGSDEAMEVYRDMVSGKSANLGPERWFSENAKKLFDNPGYTGAEKADISNAANVGMQGQIAGVKDEMYRRAARSGNPMATFNAMASAGNNASKVMADTNAANRIKFADTARADKYNVLSQLAPQAINFQNVRNQAGAAGLLAAGGQGYGQGSNYANLINQFANAQAARTGAGAAGMANLYGQESNNLQNQYEMLIKLMTNPVATETAGSKTGTGG